VIELATEPARTAHDATRVPRLFSAEPAQSYR